MAISDSFSPDNPVSRGRAFPPRTQTFSVNGAITIAHGTVMITKAGVLAGTLDSPPTSMNGARLLISTTTANAHVITCALFYNGVTNNTATWTAAAGNCMELVAWDGVWYVVSLRGVTLSAV